MQAMRPNSAVQRTARQQRTDGKSQRVGTAHQTCREPTTALSAAYGPGVGLPGASQCGGTSVSWTGARASRTSTQPGRCAEAAYLSAGCGGVRAAKDSRERGCSSLRAPAAPSARSGRVERSYTAISWLTEAFQTVRATNHAFNLGTASRYHAESSVLYRWRAHDPSDPGLAESRLWSLHD